MRAEHRGLTCRLGGVGVREPLRGSVGVAGRAGRDPVVDRHDPVGRHLEVLDHLVGDELRRGVHPRASAQRPGDQARVGERVAAAQLGIPDGRQVVHRHELGRTACGRHHEVGAVHDVDPAGPPLQRRDVGPLPGEAQRARRHRAGGHPDTVGAAGGEGVAAPPRDGERGHGEVGVGREARQDFSHEGSDAGRGAE